MATKRTASDILAEQHWKRRILNVESANNQEKCQDLVTIENPDSNNSNSVQMHQNNGNPADAQSTEAISSNWEIKTDEKSASCVEVPSVKDNLIVTVNNQEGELTITQAEGYVVIEAVTVNTQEDGSKGDLGEQSSCLSPADHCHQVAGIQVEVDGHQQGSDVSEQALDQKHQYPEQNQRIPSNNIDERNPTVIYQIRCPNETQDSVTHSQSVPGAQNQEDENSQSFTNTTHKNTETPGSRQHLNTKDDQLHTTNDSLTGYNSESTESASEGYTAPHPSTLNDSTIHQDFDANKSVVHQAHLSGYPSGPVPTSAQTLHRYSDRTNSSQEMTQQNQYVQPNIDHQNKVNFYQDRISTHQTYNQVNGFQNACGNLYQNANSNTPNANESQSGYHPGGDMSYPVNSATYSSVLQSEHSVQPVRNAERQTNVCEQSNGYYGAQGNTETHSQNIQEVSVPVQNYELQHPVQNNVHYPQQNQSQNTSIVQHVSVGPQENALTIPTPAAGIPSTQQLSGQANSQGTSVPQPCRKNDTLYPNTPSVTNNAQYPEVMEHLFNSACYLPNGPHDPSYERPLPELHHSDVASIENSKDSFYPMIPTGPHPNFCPRPPYSPLGMQPQYWPPPHQGNPICSAKPYGRRNYRHAPYPFPPCPCNASHSPARHHRGYHNGISHLNHGPRHRQSYSSPYAEYGHGDAKMNSRRNSSCCHTPHGDSDCSMFSSDNGLTPSPASGRPSCAIRGRPSGDFSVEGAQFHSRMMRSSDRDSFSPSSDSDDNSFSSAQPGLGGISKSSSGNSIKNSLSDPNNPVLSSLPAPGLQRTKFLVSTYIDYLVEENEKVTDMSKAFTPPTYLYLEEEEYVVTAHKEDSPFPSHGFSKFIKDYFPQVDAISVPETKSNDINCSNINRLNLSEKTFDEFAHTVFFGCQDMIERKKKAPVTTIPHTVTHLPQIPTAVAGN